MDSTARRVPVEHEAIPETERTLVLLGRTGNGKSETGNTILGNKMFDSRPSAKAVTKKCERHQSKIRDGLTVKVIDTPGLFSAGSSKKGFTIKEIFHCLKLAEKGTDAVLLVFSLGNRITDEEQETLPALKILFGNDIVKYMIVVFTHGDVLRGETLEDYLEDCDEFEDILKECNGRKVVFNNLGNEKDKRENVDDLLNLVEQVSRSNNGQPFMSELSKELWANEAMIEEKKKQIEEMKGRASKQEISQMTKDAEKSKTRMEEELREKIANQLKESIMKDVHEQLAKSQAAREETEKKLSEMHKLSSEEIRRLRQQLKKAEKETVSLQRQLKNRCTIL